MFYHKFIRKRTNEYGCRLSIIYIKRESLSYLTCVTSGSQSANVFSSEKQMAHNTLRKTTVTLFYTNIIAVFARC